MELNRTFCWRNVENRNRPRSLRSSYGRKQKGREETEGRESHTGQCKTSPASLSTNRALNKSWVQTHSYSPWRTTGHAVRIRWFTRSPLRYTRHDNERIARPSSRVA